MPNLLLGSISLDLLDLVATIARLYISVKTSCLDLCLDPDLQGKPIHLQHECQVGGSRSRRMDPGRNFDIDGHSNMKFRSDPRIQGLLWISSLGPPLRPTPLVELFIGPWKSKIISCVQIFTRWVSTQDR